MGAGSWIDWVCLEVVEVMAWWYLSSNVDLTRVTAEA